MTSDWLMLGIFTGLFCGALALVGWIGSYLMRTFRPRLEHTCQAEPWYTCPACELDGEYEKSKGGA